MAITVHFKLQIITYLKT